MNEEFKFHLDQEVTIVVAGNKGFISGLCRIVNKPDKYLVIHKDSSNRVIETRFDESELDG